VPTNQQRRETERRRLQRQLEQRRAKEASRKRATLIISIVGTLVVIAAVAIIVVVATGGSDKKPSAAAPKSTAATATPTPSPTTTAATAPPAAAPTAPCATPRKGASATFKGVTVGKATDLKQAPKVTAKGTATFPTLQCQDLVVGSGKAATPASTVTVQYTGVLYANGKEFDSSWTNGGKAVQFPLNGVIPGFTQGIGGAGKVAPMKVGGRRVMILPGALAYGASPPDGSNIPANATLVFIVDLKSIDA
jgi:FKBP-type peptidyl-prolyl cis-trans isomerase